MSTPCPCGYNKGRPTEIGCGAKDCPKRETSISTPTSVSGRHRLTDVHAKPAPLRMWRTGVPLDPKLYPAVKGWVLSR